MSHIDAAIIVFILGWMVSVEWRLKKPRAIESHKASDGGER